MALAFLSSLLIIKSSILLIEAKEIEQQFNFLNAQSKHSVKTKTEMNLKNFYSWQEPTSNSELLLYTPDFIDNNLIQASSTNLSSSSKNRFNNLDSNLSDLNLIPNLSSTNFSMNSSANLTNDLSSAFNSSDFNLIENSTELTVESEVSNVNTLYDVPVHLIVLLALAYGLVSLTAVVGNSIVLWFVVRSRKLRTVTNIFIANLAIADILIGALAIPFQFQAALLQRWVLPHIMFSFCSFVQIVSVNVSVGTLSAIAADRYLIVFYPIKYRMNKKQAKFIIAFIWIFSVMAAVPALIALRVVDIPDLINITINQELSSALLSSLASIKVNSTEFPDLAELQNTLNLSSTTTDWDNSSKHRSSTNGTNFVEERPTRTTLFLLDDVLAKIDLIQNKDEKLGSLLGNISITNNATLPLKPWCGNVNFAVEHWRMYNLFLVLVQYFIPLVVITFAYTKMGLKLRETDQHLNKRSSSKLLQRINTASSAGFSSSSVRTTNNNLIVSPAGTINCNMQMAIELQQTRAQTTNQVISTLQNTGKRCRSLDCSPLEEGACIMAINDRKCSQSNTPTGRHSPHTNQCINCTQHAYHNLAQQQINSTNASARNKHHRTSCTNAECCKGETIVLNNNNNETLLNKNKSSSCNASIKKNGIGSCNKKANDNVDHENCMHKCNHNCTQTHCIHNHHSLHRHHQSPQSPSQQSPQHPIQHHSSLQPTGSIHSNLMMPVISHPISALRVNPNAEYIVINKKKVIKMLFIVCSLFVVLWLPLQTYNLLKDFFYEINGYRYINVIWFVMHFMAMLSASTNPFVYAIYSLRN